ncbi:MAG: preprotein translocase subunit YajC [Burkholderiales bacterium]
MFISNAYADNAGGFEAIMQRPDFLVIGLMVVAMYFVMIRPQMKRQKELKAMMDALAKGDEVVAAGGILGRIVKVTDAYLTLEVSTGTEIIIQRGAVSLLLPKGTIKAL